jgi:plasmid stability protein
MKNVTISLDEETARWVRIEAAEHDTSVSRFVGELLRQRMRRNAEYEAAKESYLSRGAWPLGKPGEEFPSREEIHDREVDRKGAGDEEALS